MMRSKILIVGAGEIGTALAWVLSSKKGAEVSMWDVKPFLCTHGRDLPKLAEEADFVFLSVPSFAIAQCALSIKPYISRSTIVTSLTKGLERSTGKLTSELLIHAFGKKRTAIMGGPMLAEELRNGLFTRVMLGSTKNVFNQVSKLFRGTNLVLVHTNDIRGVSAAGVLKNIYALAMGMADGLGLGANAKGVIVSHAFQEMQFLIRRLGGKEETAAAYAGLGDLEATGNSDYSTNRALGKKLAKGGKKNLASEGAGSLRLLLKRLNMKELPSLLAAIKSVVLGNKNARDALEKFFSK